MYNHYFYIIIQGTGLESDFRFKNKDKELKSQLQNPSCYSSPVF